MAKIQARDITGTQIEQALQFARVPMEEMWKAPMRLQPYDLVTMTMRELGHLMAFYAAVQESKGQLTRELAAELKGMASNLNMARLVMDAESRAQAGEIVQDAQRLLARVDLQLEAPKE